MDQLLAGAGEEGVTYSRAVALLGFTDTSLIDRAVDALANQDQAGLFGCVSDVIDAGHDPRRFAMDLLDRFRDLLVVQAVPDAFDTGLVDAPADQREVLTAQAQAVGQATLTRCASLVNEGLAQMRGRDRAAAAAGDPVRPDVAARGGDDGRGTGTACRGARGRWGSRGGAVRGRTSLCA
jgi:DNA polymerase-3 subunit gamma/tau